MEVKLMHWDWLWDTDVLVRGGLKFLLPVLLYFPLAPHVADVFRIFDGILVLPRWTPVCWAASGCWTRPPSSAALKPTRFHRCSQHPRVPRTTWNWPGSSGPPTATSSSWPTTARSTGSWCRPSVVQTKHGGAGEVWAGRRVMAYQSSCDGCVCSRICNVCSCFLFIVPVRVLIPPPPRLTLCQKVQHHKNRSLESSCGRDHEVVTSCLLHFRDATFVFGGELVLIGRKFWLFRLDTFILHSSLKLLAYLLLLTSDWAPRYSQIFISQPLLWIRYNVCDVYDSTCVKAAVADVTVRRSIESLAWLDLNSQEPFVLF